MSDNPTDAAPVAVDDATPPADAPADTPATEAPSADAVAASDAPPDAPATDDKPDEPVKPPQGERRYAILVAKLAAESRARAEAETRASNAEALLGANKPDGDAPQAPHRPDPDAVDRRAREIIAERSANQSRAALIAAGAKELGEAVWNEKTGIIATLGATDNADFMRAIVEIPGGHRVVAALADDADALVSLLEMSPVAMGVKLGRMAAELDVAPKPKALSSAPRPVAPVGGRAQAAPSIHDTKNQTTEEWMALRNRTAPRHLGGEGKSH